MSDPTPSGREPSLPFEPDRTGDEPSLGGDSFLSEIRAALSSTDEELHRSALNRLAEIKTQQGFDLVLELLNHPFAEVRDRAVNLLAQSGDPQAVPALMEAIRVEDDRLQVLYPADVRLEILHSQDEELSSNALAAYSLLTSMLDALGKCAASADETLKERAAVFIAPLFQRDFARYTAEIQSFAATRTNNSMLPPEHQHAAYLITRGPGTIARVLSAIAHPASIPALLEALSEKNDYISASCEDALTLIYQRYPDPALRQQIIDGAFDALRVPTNGRGYSAIYVLHDCGNDEVVPRLITLLTDPDPLNRRGAVMALPHFLKSDVPDITDPDIVQRVIGLRIAGLDDSNNDVRLAAAGGLEYIDPTLLQNAVPALIRLLSDSYGDEYETIGDRAASALEHIGTPEALEALQAHYRPAVSTLLQHADDALPLLVTLLSGPNASIRQGALEALIQFYDPFPYDPYEYYEGLAADPELMVHVIEPLAAHFDDPHEEARINVSHTFFRLSRSMEPALLERAVPALIRVLNNPHGDMLGLERSSAAVLEHIGTPEALAALAAYQSSR